MTRLPIILIALLASALAGCGDRPEQGVAPTPENTPAPSVGDQSPAIAMAQEAISFAGDPLYRPALDAARQAEIEARAAPLEAMQDRSEDDYIALARIYVSANRFQDAIALYTQGLEEHPESFKLRRHRGHRYINVRELDKAIADLNVALELIGDAHKDVLEYDTAGHATGTYEHWVWYHVGLFHYLNENWDEAVTAYQVCVDTALDDKGRVGATDWLYNALQKAGRPVEAEAAIAAIPANPDMDHNHAYFKRVMLYKGEMSVADIFDVDKPVDEWTGGDMTTAYGVANWYLFNGDADTAASIHHKILETPYWNSWAWVVTDKQYADR